jgi:hypothetical protein
MWLWLWQLSHLRLAAVRSEKLAAVAGDSSGTEMNGDICGSKPLPSSVKWRMRRLSVCCSDSDLWSETVVVICSYDCNCPINPTTNPNPVYKHSITWQYTYVTILSVLWHRGQNTEHPNVLWNLMNIKQASTSGEALRCWGSIGLQFVDTVRMHISIYF